MLYIYNIAIFFYQLALKLASPFHPKAKQWVEGRKNIFEKIKEDVSKKDKIWVHCASLGEFEQGRPIIEWIKKKLPHYEIFLTFYSPSGYEVRKNYDLADYIFYMPADTAQNAAMFIEAVNPKLAIFVKYEFWHHHLSGLKKANIPSILVAAIFRKEQIFFKPYGSWFANILGNFSHIFVQDQNSSDLIKSIGIKEVSIAGDPRVDRVLAHSKSVKELPIIKEFTAFSPTLVIGSSWRADEEIICDFITKRKDSNWKYIFAPHEIKERNIKWLEKQLPLKSQRFSALKNTALDEDTSVLIIDNIGMLSSIYQYADIAYIGGGFGVGIHNTLEAIVFEIPVIFGSKFQKFSEAVWLTEHQGAFSINNSEELNSCFERLEQPEMLQASGKSAKQFIIENQGATLKIGDYLRQY